MVNFFSVYKFFIGLVCLGVWIGYVGMGSVVSNSGLVVELDLLSSGALDVTMPLMVDVYSVVFSLVVVLISGCVMFYNGFYMDGEVYYDRFCKLVFLFVLSMLFLVMIPSFLGLMVGWDGLGLTSYLLVIYYQDKRSLGSGTLTVLSNRVGDVLFFVGIGVASGVGSWGFVDLGVGEFMGVLCGVVMVGCMTKSAQLPFCAWLPAAMAAPSPVSALVHSSTLVTAGVYVLIRFSSVIDSGWFLFLGAVSSMTMFLSAMSAVFEPDVKKVVALSTLSQLGVMMLSISVGAISVCFFHLVSHAMFKALMFLCVGAIIHFSGIQDLRYLGGMAYSSPIVVGWLVVSCLSLSGFPFLAGFYSKDLVIEAFLSGGLSGVLSMLVVVSTALTSLYGGLMAYSVSVGFLSKGWSGGMVSSEFVTVPCSVLGVGALFGGFFLQIFVLDFNEVYEVLGGLKLIPSFCFVVGGVSLITYLMYKSALSYSGVLKGSELMGDVFAKMWFTPFLSSDLFSSIVLGASGNVKGFVEDGYLEHSFGSEKVWSGSEWFSSFYMGSQADFMGVCFLKGFFFVLVTMVGVLMVGL